MSETERIAALMNHMSREARKALDANNERIDRVFRSFNEALRPLSKKHESPDQPQG